MPRYSGWVTAWVTQFRVGPANICNKITPHGPERKADSIERRVERMRARLAEGGEIAQGVLREVFPRGVWLEPDHNGGRFLWAMAQTAWPTDGPHLHNDDGTARPEAFPVIYRRPCNQVGALLD